MCWDIILPLSKINMFVLVLYQVPTVPAVLWNSLFAIVRQQSNIIMRGSVEREQCVSYFVVYSHFTLRISFLYAHEGLSHILLVISHVT